MLDLFYMGGPLFMGILSLIFIALIAIAIVNGFSLMKGNGLENKKIVNRLGYVRSLGLFAFIIGLLGQLIGLFMAFQAIEIGTVNVSPAMLAGGFKVSMITTIYGVIIYTVSFLIWFSLRIVAERK